MHKLSRREALRGTGVAALAAGAAVIPLPVNAKVGGELAALLKLYWQQVDEFNNADHITDDESDAHAAATYEATLHRIVGVVPAGSKDDALAAMDWLMKEHAVFGGEYGDTGPFGAAVTWLTDEVIRYIAVS